MIQNAPSVYLVLRELIVKNIVTQTVSMVCAKLMELVHVDATILCMVLDAEPHVKIHVCIALKKIHVQSVQRVTTEHIAMSVVQTVTTVLDTGFVKAANLVFMVRIVQSIVPKDVKLVHLKIDVFLVRKAGQVYYANVVKTVVRKPVDMMGNV